MATVFDVVAAALLMRANREAHKRLMLLAHAVSGTDAWRSFARSLTTLVS